MTTDTTAAHPTVAQPATPRLVRAARAAAPWIHAGGKALDRYDAMVLGALIGLLVGLSLWIGFGPGLTTVSVLVLLLGIAAAKGANEEAARADHRADHLSEHGRALRG